MSIKTTARQMGLRGNRAMRKKTTAAQRRAWAKKGALATKKIWNQLSKGKKI